MTESKVNTIVSDCKESISYKTLKIQNSDKLMLCDEEDYESLSKLKIILNKSGYACYYYYCKETKKTPKLLVHRLIVNCPMDMVVDHKNHNKIDNRKCNLRVCTNKENSRNISKTRGKSKYKGVIFIKELGKFRATISFENKTKILGFFLKEEDAAITYDIAAKIYFKNFACLNFPNLDTSNIEISSDKCILSKKNTTGYRGVTFDKLRNKFCAKIRINGVTKNIGRFDLALDAANAYDKAAIIYHGNNAILNFS